MADRPLRPRQLTNRTPQQTMIVDVKRLGNIPDGGGWCYVGR